MLVIRWIVSLLALVLIAAYLVLSPALFSQAAAPAPHTHIAAPVTYPQPNMYWPSR